MNILFSLPDPNELAPDAPCIATTTLREELRRLQEKHGNQSAPLIKDLESIIVRLEEQYGQQTSVIEREIAEKYKVCIHPLHCVLPSGSGPFYRGESPKCSAFILETP